MQRPRSEGRRPDSHSQSRPSLVTRSLQFGTGDHGGRNQGSDLSQPRRPNTTPKPRVQRLLPTPGQSTTQDWNSSRQSMALPPSTLMQLPNSPPRLPSVRSIERIDTSKETQFARGSEATTKKAAPGSVSTTVDMNRIRQSADTSTFEKTVVGHTEVQSMAHFQSNFDTLDETSPSLLLFADSCYSSNNEQDADNFISPRERERNTDSLEPEQGGEGDEYEHSTNAADVAGPVLTDIRSEVVVNRDGANQDDDHQDTKESVIENDDDDDEYKQVLANRKQLLNDEADRQRIREELETYVGSLRSRTDENGEHLVEFPRNYQQIVSLMTQKDVSEEDSKSQEGQHTRQSWSRVLIESGLSKQQAFGVLEDVDNDLEGSSSLAAKIALKMARIRQLDTILEEKLGKNLYSSIVPRKQKRTQSLLPDMTGNSSSRTFVTQTQSITPSATISNGGETSRSSTSISQSSSNDDEKAIEAKKSNYFIERNKQVVANGMKANMTKDEEDRLEILLRNEVIRDDDRAVGDDSTKPESTAVPEECNEFTMTDAEKKAIEELVASKSGAYPLFAIDEDGLTSEALLPSEEGIRPAKGNIIQETKRERLQRHRLSRVEQELRFLQESTSVVIVGDDHDEDENEDCRSEKSYVTVASSTCSTRSGVISRHDFKCFLAQQKESFRSTPTASADEIRRLLLSMGHGTSAPSNAMTATTG